MMEAADQGISGQAWPGSKTSGEAARLTHSLMGLAGQSIEWGKPHL